MSMKVLYSHGHACKTRANECGIDDFRILLIQTKIGNEIFQVLNIQIRLEPTPTKKRDIHTHSGLLCISQFIKLTIFPNVNRNFSLVAHSAVLIIFWQRSNVIDIHDIRLL